MSRFTCKCCAGSFSFSEHRTYHRYGFCHKTECQVAYQKWRVANFDLLPDDDKYKCKLEDDFWELSDVQREHYSHFLSLINTRKPKRRLCLKCRDEMAVEGRAICGQCKIINSRIGKLAEL